MTEETQQSNENMEDLVEEAEVPAAIYVSPNAPFLTIPVKDCKIKFENGKFETSDPEIIEIMDEQLKYPAIARFVRKVDMDAARAVVEAHKRQMRNAGIVGAMNTDHLAEMRRIQQKVYDAELSKVAADPKAAAELKEQISDTMLTEPGIVNPPEPDLRQPPVQPEDKPAENTPTNPFQALGKNKE